MIKVAAKKKIFHIFSVPVHHARTAAHNQVCKVVQDALDQVRTRIAPGMGREKMNTVVL